MSKEALGELKCLRVFFATLDSMPHDPPTAKANAFSTLRAHGLPPEPDRETMAQRRRARGGRTVGAAAAILGRSSVADLLHPVMAHINARGFATMGEERTAAHIVNMALEVEVATAAGDITAMHKALIDLGRAQACHALIQSNVLHLAPRFRGQATIGERKARLTAEIIEKRRGSALNDSAWKAMYCAEGSSPIMFEHARNGPAPVTRRTIQEHLTAARKDGALK